MGLVRRCRQLPAMGLGDRAADRQSHANPIGFGRVERLEQPVEFLRIEPRTGVLHFDYYVVRIVCAGHDRKLSRPVTGTSHCIDGIGDQINEHLSNAVSIPNHLCRHCLFKTEVMRLRGLL